MAAAERLSGGILTFNAGSSSVKFAWYPVERATKAALRGTVEGAAAAAALIDDLAARIDLATLDAVGHRVVLSARRDAAMEITPAVLAELQRSATTDPEHLPSEIALMTEFAARHPPVRQFACFDSAFHRTLPPVARTLPIPARFTAMGIERIGFHGLSCAYLMEELARVAGADAAQGRVIVAHLGGGCSVTAVVNGRSIDTTMGFTPAGGIPMATRSGDLDPGVMLQLMRVAGTDWASLNHIINHESGMVGIAGTGDMRQLLARRTKDPRAALALDLFSYHISKAIGAAAAALGGVDTLIFSGGIGENAADIRRDIIDPLGFLGIALDDARNRGGSGVISADGGSVTVRAMHTDEEAVIARSVRERLHDTPGS